MLQHYIRRTQLFQSIICVRHYSSIFYLRRIGEDFPERVFGESAPAAQAGNTGTIIGFLDETRVSLTKVGHITPDEWKAMVDEMQQELKGQKPH